MDKDDDSWSHPFPFWLVRRLPLCIDGLTGANDLLSLRQNGRTDRSEQESFIDKEPEMKKAALTILMLAFILVAIWAVAPVSAAPGPQNNERLENVFRREQSLLGDQQERHMLANRVVTKAEEWIRHLQGEGKDTTSLEEAFGQYAAAVATAGQHLDAAAAALGSGAGFDGNGKTTDRGKAAATISDAGKAQRQFHLTITPAAIQFRAAVMAYLQKAE